MTFKTIHIYFYADEVIKQNVWKKYKIILFELEYNSEL